VPVNQFDISRPDLSYGTDIGATASPRASLFFGAGGNPDFRTASTYVFAAVNEFDQWSLPIFVPTPRYV
jgi:hypothetical protein